MRHNIVDVTMDGPVQIVRHLYVRIANMVRVWHPIHVSVILHGTVMIVGPTIAVWFVGLMVIVL